MHFELRRKGMTLLLLWHEYQQANVNLPTYQYTQFCQYYHDYAATLRRSMRQVHRAGEKLFIDCAGQTVPLVDPATGEMRRAHIFVAVLGASNYTYACATDRETQVDWLCGLSQAFAYFGGVTDLVIPDNPKALITVTDPTPSLTALREQAANLLGNPYGRAAFSTTHVQIKAAVGAVLNSDLWPPLSARGRSSDCRCKTRSTRTKSKFGHHLCAIYDRRRQRVAEAA